MVISAYLSTITLNVNEINPPLKRYNVAIGKKKYKQTNKQNSSKCCLQETHFRATDTHRL